MALHPFSSPDWQMGGAEPPEPRSWSSCIAIVVVMVVVLLVVLVVALLKLQKKNIGFPASATLSQQASDAGLMEEIQELAELTQPEDTSGGDRGGNRRQPRGRKDVEETRFAGEPGSWSNRIAEVVVPVVGAMMVVALLIWQIKNIARYTRLFCSRRDFPARAAPFQQAGDSGPMQEMQELAELTQPEDASGGDRSAMLNGKLLGSAEMLNAGGLESGEG
ncbi:hypothetical protein KIL84_002092 [Mauremys mutica]|uniref:Uncharacterized protein n=1 Tax=Mauremys mutica TaxID=74926 RepID=A0A9D3XJP1_9SAUR|nr:hypothetical protein KIL84_002092 [Mauremys mutica]